MAPLQPRLSPLDPVPAPLDPGASPQQYGPLTKIPSRHPDTMPELLPPPGGDQSPNGPTLGGPALGAPTYGAPALGDLSAPPSSSPASPAERGNGGPPAIGGEQLAVIVEAPTDAKTGEEVTFKLTVRNLHEHAVKDVVVQCSLPEGMVVPGYPDRVFRQKPFLLESHGERVLDIVLRCERAGRLCVEFQVSAEGVEQITKSGCVLSRDESVQLDLSGPSERTAGGRVEYVITLANLTGRELPDVHVVLEHEGVLQPREASTGVLKKPGRLEWDLGLVRVDERVQIQAEFACDSPTEQTYVTARVVGRNLEPREVTSSLQVTPRGEIEINVADVQDPVDVGEKVLYLVRVTNHGLRPVSDLMLKFEPDGLQPLGVRIDGEDALSSADFDPQTGVLRLPLPRSLLADGTQTVTLEATATHPGQVGLRATVGQRSGSTLATIAESTVVNTLPSSIASGSR